MVSMREAQSVWLCECLCIAVPLSGVGTDGDDARLCVVNVIA